MACRLPCGISSESHLILLIQELSGWTLKSAASIIAFPQDCASDKLRFNLMGNLIDTGQSFSVNI
jgi:hypothetical protein